MPWSGTPPNETPSRTTGLQTGSTAWADTETAGRGIEATDQDTHDQDINDMIGDCLKRDGGNEPSADIGWGGFKITGLGDPSSTTDAANKQYVDGVATGLTNFAVRLASTANVVIASALEDTDTIDSVTLVTGDRVLLKDQTDATENGIYVASASGAASRATDMDAWSETIGAIVNVSAGTVNAGLSFRSLANTGGTLGSTDLEFSQFGTSLSTPVGIADGGTGQTTASAAFSALKQAATSSATGVVELATSAETITGTDTGRAVTPAGGAAAYEPLGATIGINTQTDNYTLVLTDAGKIVEMNAATAKAITIPTNASVAFVTKAYFNAVRYGAGALTVVGATGVTINGVSAGTITIASQYGSATVYKRGADEWVAPGFTAS